MRANPLALAQDVDIALFEIRRGDRTDEEKAHLTNDLFGRLEGALTAAYALGNEEDVLAWRSAIDHLKSQVGNMR